MHIAQIEKNLTELVKNISRENFIYDLLLAYGVPKTTITLLKKGDRNLSNRAGEIILKKKLFFREVTHREDPHLLIDFLKNDENTNRHDPRFIVVTNYDALLAIDTKTDTTLDIPIDQLHKHPFFFGPWAKIERVSHVNENPADVKAAEKMGKLYDELLKDNQFQSKEDLHSLNIFLSRLLFCFFAEDTGIFEQNSFTNSISSYTQMDGSDLDSYLNKLFEVLDTKNHSQYPHYLAVFPYVNGGLFNEKYSSPIFSRKSRKMIIECGELDWSDINPDIFGSMIQAVVHVDQRGNMGMHYTSVPNIMKVIEPLFLNDLREEFEKHYDNKNKLEQLALRFEKIRIFDPACGSGNFLIIAYKELRELEIEIFHQIQELAGNKLIQFSRISLSQFYGIEIDDFAHEIAILSMWLVEHQMNMKFQEIFGEATPTLPLKPSGNIVCGNATRTSWEDICPKQEDAEIYILGNPPYLGARVQDKNQKNDMKYVFDSFLTGYNDLDYICCWFFKGANYIKNANAQMGFVTTNSISQGEQVTLLWPNIFSMDLEIGFAHNSFKWTNHAKGNAGVSCVIIGIRNLSKQNKLLYANGISQVCSNISPYLTDSLNTFISPRKIPLSKIQKIGYGCSAIDGGYLILSPQEKYDLLQEYPEAKKIIRQIIGSQELIKGVERWCLWIEDKDLQYANQILPVKERIQKVSEFRNKSKRSSTARAALKPHKFGEARLHKGNIIVIPKVSSERRKYIPIGFVSADCVIMDKAFPIYNADPYLFGIVSSSMHMVWIRAIAGRLKTDYSYSSSICYNTFPIHDLSDKQKEIIAAHVYNVLEEREKYSEKTMANLYDPEKMPDGLQEAHQNLDLAVERCYRSKPFECDEERLEYLFKLYEEMIKKEKGGDLLLVN